MLQIAKARLRRSAGRVQAVDLKKALVEVETVIIRRRDSNSQVGKYFIYLSTVQVIQAYLGHGSWSWYLSFEDL